LPSKRHRELNKASEIAGSSHTTPTSDAVIGEHYSAPTQAPIIAQGSDAVQARLDRMEERMDRLMSAVEGRLPPPSPNNNL